jgi:hypothetical protein
LYQYNVLPQGVKVAVDIFQERMGTLFLDMATFVVYMDDSIVLGYGDFDMHLTDVEEVLRRLERSRFPSESKKVCLVCQIS